MEIKLGDLSRVHVSDALADDETVYLSIRECSAGPETGCAQCRVTTEEARAIVGHLISVFGWADLS